MKLCPVNIEEIRHLTGHERTMAISKYHDWLDSQRKEDRKGVKREMDKVYYFKNRRDNPEKLKAYKRSKTLEYRKDKVCIGCGKNIQEYIGYKKFCPECSVSCQKNQIGFWRERDSVMYEKYLVKQRVYGKKKRMKCKKLNGVKK